MLESSSSACWRSLNFRTVLITRTLEHYTIVLVRVSWENHSIVWMCVRIARLFSLFKYLCTLCVLWKSHQMIKFFPIAIEGWGIPFGDTNIWFEFLSFRRFNQFLENGHVRINALSEHRVKFMQKERHNWTFADKFKLNSDTWARPVSPHYHLWFDSKIVVCLSFVFEKNSNSYTCKFIQLYLKSRISFTEILFFVILFLFFVSYEFCACHSCRCGFAIFFCLVSLCLEVESRRAWYCKCIA